LRYEVTVPADLNDDDETLSLPLAAIQLNHGLHLVRRSSSAYQHRRCNPVPGRARWLSHACPLIAEVTGGCQHIDHPVQRRNESAAA
jgi:hypothetical protein